MWGGVQKKKKIEWEKETSEKNGGRITHELVDKKKFEGIRGV